MPKGHRANVTRLPKRYVQPDDDPLMREGITDYSDGFVRVRNDWIEWAVTNLTVREFTLVLLLAKYQGNKEWAFPQQKTLAEKMGISRQYINEVIHRLESKQQIEIKRNKGGRSLYRVTWVVNSSLHLPKRALNKRVGVNHRRQGVSTPVDRGVNSRRQRSEADTKKQTQEADSIEGVCSPAASVVETRRADADAPLDTRSRVSLPTLSPEESEECHDLYTRYKEWLEPRHRFDLPFLRECDSRARARGLRRD